MKTMLAKASILNDTAGKMRRYAELEKPPTHLELLEFSKQFTREEWEILCKNRGFIHFLAEDLPACRLLAKKVLERHRKVVE